MFNQKDLIKPLIFLDIFDYPPTAMEIWRFLGVKAELGEVIKMLETIDPPRPSATPEVSGFTTLPEEGTNNSCFNFLPGREELIEKRREFTYLSEKKFKIAKWAAWLLHFIPSVKMIAVCNNFYYRPQSDIDFFIITAPNRLWLTRFFATIILDIFGLRARGKKTADRVCLSFYLSEKSLNLEKIALDREIDPSRGAQDDKKNIADSSRGVSISAKTPADTQDDKMKGDDKKNINDPYLSYWLAFLEPIYGQKCYTEFWQANDWLRDFFPNALPKEPAKIRRVEDNKLSLAVKKIKGYIFNGALGDWIEQVVKDLQWQKISPRVKGMAAAADTKVVINDVMLKFHENDRRKFFRDEFEKKFNMNK